MNISVRVLSAQAQSQIKALQAQVATLDAQLARANATSASPTGFASPRSRKSLMAWGNQIQWTGRQLQYNFTLPLLLAAGAATKFALDNEKAFTQVKKVYGDATDSVAWFRKNQDAIPEGMNAVTAAAEAEKNELEALSKSFEALSTRYGVLQKDVLEAAGAWAAAGVSGAELAKSTELSLRASILGDMDLVKATKALIAIQAQYSQSADQLGLTLAQLNAIENQTGASMQDLITGFEKSAGVAREAGVDVRHLGAMIAALVPATGSASTAGNGLRTIISRLLSPTGEATKLMREFGVDTSTAAWNGATAMERLQLLANKMNKELPKTAAEAKAVGKEFAGVGEAGFGISDAQKQVIATTLGSRWQLNRFLVLMRELGPAHSYYEKALGATASRQQVFAQATDELNAVLDSNPRRLQIIWATLQNGMATAIQPMIPYILYLAQSVANLVAKFNALDPAVQKLALGAFLLLAAVGPLVRYFGSLNTLIGAGVLAVKFFVGAWASFMTVSKMVDGVAVTTRLSLLGLMGSMIKWPFQMIATGFGLIAASIMSVGGSFIRVTGISAVATKVMAAAPLAIAGAWATISAGLVAAWQFTWASIAIIHSKGMLGLIKTWTAGLILMGKSTAAAGGISTIFVSMFAAISVAITSGFVMLSMQLLKVTNAVQIFFWQMWGALKGIMAAGQLMLLSAMTTFRIVFLSGWTGLYIAMAGVSTAAYTAMLRAYVIFSQGLNAVMVASQTLMIRGYMVFTAAVNTIMTAGAAAARTVWAAMHTAMAVISSAFWSRVIQIWIAGALALPRALASIRGLLSTIWATIVAIQRTGALRAAAAAAAPFLAVGILIAGALYIFRREVVQIWNNVVGYFADSSNRMTQMVLSAWNALPQGIANALIAVVTIVRDAAMQIYEWFSYINPFARHSPSLVENVTVGMSVVSAQFGKAATSIKSHVTGAYRDINAFGAAVRNLLNGAASFDEAQKRRKIKKFAPGALQEFDQLSSRLKQLKGDLEVMQTRVDRQQAVVDRWTAAVDRANASLDKQGAKLEKLQRIQQKWQDALSEAEGRLDQFANSPIIGMGAMSDAIFENEMAQKALRLEMMRMEDVAGPLDEIRSKIEAINGAQELLRGEQAALRSAGAGSDILSHYDDQIAALEATKRQQSDAAESLNEMSSALDELQRKGEILDLENSLKFDPLTRQIEQAANAMEELPFDEIIAGVNTAAADMVKYGDKLAAATAAVEQQQGVVDKLTAARDKLKEALDREEDKLDRIQESYDAVATAIRDVESAMSDASSAADTMARKAEDAAKKAKKAGEGVLSPAVQNFRNAAGGNFADVGGEGLPIRTDWSDQTAEIDAFTQKIADDASRAFGDLNPFAPLRDKWNTFQSWLTGKWDTLKSSVGDMFSNIFSGVGGGSDFQDTVDKFRIAWATTADWFNNNVIKPIMMIWRLFWPSIREIAVNAWNGLKEIWKQIGPEVGAIVQEFAKMKPALQGFWNIAKIVLGFIIGRLTLLGKIAFSVLAKTIYPILQTVGNVFENLMQVVKGAVQIVSGFFMLFTPGKFTAGLEKIGAGIYNIFAGTFGAIGQLIKGAFKTIVMGVWGIVKGVWDWFHWLWDELVGHSIVPDMIDGIIFWFKKLLGLVQWLWTRVVQPIWNLFKQLLTGVIAAVRMWWSGITTAWTVLKTLGLWFWDNVLSPIIGMVTRLWTNFVQPALALWWEGVKVAWSALTGLSVWVWNNVLKPVFRGYKELWDDYVFPALKLWWSGIKTVWNVLKTLGKWLWSNVLQPVWKRVQDLWGKVGPELRKWWDRIKSVWNALKGIAGWVWREVLQPVVSKVRDLWVDVRDNLNKWRERFESAWSALTRIGNWFKTNVMNPIFGAVKSVWNEIKDWLIDKADFLTEPIKKVVNPMIKGINVLIKGLNKVGEVLPGKGWSIPAISELASGGDIPTRRANRGFKTTGARAIVGEGKQNYPEFVIPTDPTYRRRAKSLLSMAAGKLGLGGSNSRGVSNSPQMSDHGVPMFGVGGWLSDRWDDGKDAFTGIGKGAWNGIKTLGKKGLDLIMKPALAVARAAVKKVSWVYPREIGEYNIDKISDWFSDTNKQYKDGYQEGKKKYSDTAQVAVSDPSNPTGRTSWKGGTFTNRFIAHMKKAEQLAGSSVSVTQGGFRPRTSYSGTSHQGDAIDFQVNASLIKAFRKVGIAAGDRTGLGNWAPHTHAVPGPASGSAAGSAVWQYQDYLAKGGPAQSLNSTWGLKSGGIALARKGPTLARIGDGRYDEAVVPLPKGWRSGLIGSSEGDRVININGNLSFPNIKSGDDAKTFLDNLENLSED